MKNKISFYLIALIPLIYFLISYQTMPDQVVIHWNASGQADRYGSPLIYTFLALFPLLILIVDNLYHRFSTSVKNKKQLNHLINGLVIFFSFVSILLTSQATNEQLAYMRVLVILLGSLFIYSGNMMNKLEQNKTFGIRIPATLRNEKVWNRIHYLGGYLFFILGVITIATAFIFSNPTISMLSMIILLFIVITFLFIYSEILYRKETGHSSFSKAK